jgi:YfiR/HmsC-like
MGRRRVRQPAIVSVLAFTVCLTFAHLACPQSKSQEYRVEATYLSNFGKFVHWPVTTTKDLNFVICVLGSDPFGKMLDVAVAGEKINNQSVITRRIATEREASACRIVFISASEANRLAEILNELNNASILTVSDMPDFTASGGMIQFVVMKEKVRFEVNIAASNAAKLTLSSQLLKVAANVKREPPPGEKTQ